MDCASGNDDALIKVSSVVVVVKDGDAGAIKLLKTRWLAASLSLSISHSLVYMALPIINDRK